MSESRVLPRLYLLIYVFSCTDKVASTLTPFEMGLACLAMLALYLSSLRIGIYLIAGQWVQIALNFPNTPNHEFILALYGVLWMGLGHKPSELLRSSQMLMGVVYAVAGVHKLNSAYWNPDLSCLTFLLPWGKSFIPGLSLLSVLFEFYLSAVFLSPYVKKKYLALYPALFFHFILSPLGFWDFASVAVTLLAKSKERMTTSASVGLVLHLAVYTFAGNLDYKWKYLLSSLTCWMVLISMIDFSFVPSSLPVRKSIKVFLALVVFWGLGPYWGGPHYPTFSMFSNLQLQSVSSNSWLLKKPLLEIDQEWWKLIEYEKPQGLPYFSTYILHKDKNTLFHENHLYEENRSGKMILEHWKTGERKKWPEDFPLSSSPNKFKKIFLSRRQISYGLCQW